MSILNTSLKRDKINGESGVKKNAALLVKTRKLIIAKLMMFAKESLNHSKYNYRTVKRISFFINENERNTISLLKYFDVLLKDIDNNSRSIRLETQRYCHSISNPEEVCAGIKYNISCYSELCGLQFELDLNIKNCLYIISLYGYINKNGNSKFTKYKKIINKMRNEIISISSELIEEERDYRFVCNHCMKTSDRNHFSIPASKLSVKRYICNDCSENFMLCECCKKYENIDMCKDISSKNHKIACDRCIRKLCYRCDHCNNIFIEKEVPKQVHRIDYSWQSYTSCEICWDENHEECECCGDDYWERNHNRSYFECADCMDDTVIQDYNPNNIKFISNNNDEIVRSSKPQKNEIYMGVEYEVYIENYYTTANEIRRNIDPKKKILWLKEDCSLDYGFEMCTYPCTLEYHQKHFPWQAVCDYIMEYDGEPEHEQAGIHIHIGRGNLSKINECKIPLILSKHQSRMEGFANRCCTGYARYIRFSEIKELLKSRFSYCTHILQNGKQRNAVVNMQRSDTIEYRLFQSTSCYKTILSYIELVHYINSYVQFTNFTTILSDKSWEHFVNNIDKKMYPNLYRRIKPSSYKLSSYKRGK